jgi:hypothetical protein
MFGWFSRNAKAPFAKAKNVLSSTASEPIPVVASVLLFEPEPEPANQAPQLSTPSPLPPPPQPVEILNELVIATRQWCHPSIPFAEQLVQARQQWTDTLSTLTLQLILRQRTHADVLVEDLMKCREHLKLDFAFKYPTAEDTANAALMLIDEDADDSILEAYEAAEEGATRLREQELAAMLEPPFAQTFWLIVAAKCDVAQFETHMATLMEADRAAGGTAFPETLAYHVQQLEVWRPWYLLGTFGFLLHWREHAQAITPFVPELIRWVEWEDEAERESALRNDDDDDAVDWVSYRAMQAYVTDVVRHLPGLAPEDYCGPDCPEHVRSFLMRDQLFAAHWYVVNVAKAAVGYQSRPNVDASVVLQPNLPALSTAAIGVEFEQRLKAAVLRAFAGAEIQTTPMSGDHGADLLIRLGSVVVAIQAKRYIGVVGNAAVQEIFAAKQFYDADFAMVVTTSRYTQPAQVLAAKLEVTLATEQSFVAQLRALLV